MILYLITNRENGKKYVGITTKTALKRWREHVKDANRGIERALPRAIRLYGVDAFDIVTLGSAISLDELKAMEIAAIAEHKSFGVGGYNMTAGGDGMLEFVFSDEERTKRRQRKLGTTLSELGRAKLRAFHTGGTHTEETKAKLRAKRAVQPPTFGMLGKTRTAEAKAKTSASLKGRRKSPETIERMRAAARRRMAKGRNGAVNG